MFGRIFMVKALHFCFFKVFVLYYSLLFLFFVKKCGWTTVRFAREIVDLIRVICENRQSRRRVWRAMAACDVSDRERERERIIFFTRVQLLLFI